MSRRTRPRETYDCSRAGTLPTRTQQHFKEDCDINNVIRKYGQTGMWAHLDPREATYGDFSQETDLTAATQLVDQAQREFDALPAAVRALCQNDPVMLLHNLANETSAAQLVAAGLPVEPVPRTLEEQIASGVQDGLAKTPEGVTSGEEEQTGPVSPSS